MRRVVAWGLLRPRTWIAFGVAYVATTLAAGDGQPGWTVLVAAATFALAGLSMWAHFLDENEDDAPADAEPEPAASRSRHDEWVAESVRRYEERIGRAAPPAEAPVEAPAEVPTDVPSEVPPEAAPEVAPAPARRQSRQEREAAEILRRYEEQAEARRAALKESSGPQ